MNSPTEEQVERFARDLASRVGYTWGSSGVDQEEWLANCRAALAAVQPSPITEQLAKALRDILPSGGPLAELLWDGFPDTEPASITVKLGCIRNAHLALAAYEASKKPRPDPEEWR